MIDAVTDDGLEQLTLRFALPDYSDAHVSRRGPDGGVDVLSDMGLPPARGWQCKNVKKIDWDDCRASLKAAMTYEHPPAHYTFVFPNPLTGGSNGQLNFWRETFLPEQLALYGPTLETLDFWDDLAQQLAERPDLINRLNEGALASSYLKVAEVMNTTGINPLASMRDLVGDAPELARRAVEASRNDPHFDYEKRQRGVRSRDHDIPDGRLRIGMEAQLGRPRQFTATIRMGDAVQEDVAEPREDLELGPIELWFADTETAAEAREDARIELAAGRPVDLTLSADVGLDARPLPDRLVVYAETDGILRSGTTKLGLSNPLTLRMLLVLNEENEKHPAVEIALHRIPSEPGFSISYGGSFHGALFFIDLNQTERRLDDGPTRWVDMSIAMGIDIKQVVTRDLLAGLQLLAYFGHAQAVHLICEGVFKDEGVSVDVAGKPLGDNEAALLRRLTLLATVMAGLTELDGLARTLPTEGDDSEISQALRVLPLLQDGEIRQSLDRPIRFTLPDTAKDLEPAEILRGVQSDLGELVGHPTVIAELSVQGEATGAFVDDPDQIVLEVTPAQAGSAEAVLKLVGPAPGAATAAE